MFRCGLRFAGCVMLAGMTDKRPVFGSDEFIRAIGKSVATMPGQHALLVRAEDIEVLGYALRELLALPDAAEKLPGWVPGGA